MRVLVCGGRDYPHREKVWDVLDDLHKDRPITQLIEGAATGADQWARTWAWTEKEITIRSFPADWEAHGRKAGPLRNQRMIDEGKPDLVVAFPGGRGTADMVRRARAAGVEVREIGPKNR